MKFDLDTIQKIWIILGTLIATLGMPWIPGFVTNIFSPEGTEIFFRLFGAIAGAWQFIDLRTGKGQPSQLKSHEDPVHVAKYLWPFTRAAA